jgi:tRNA threonylcarbamoyladenosine biosynthesis protein TsaE
MIDGQYILKSIAESQALALQIAQYLCAGDVVTFSGDLGSGKTFLCREIIRFYCGYDTIVQSPSFNLLQIYQADHLQIYHYDFYRLKSAEELYELGIEEALNGNIVLIEWPEIATHMLPLPKVEVQLSFDGKMRRCNIIRRSSTQYRD